jgi:hypothetical protein
MELKKFKELRFSSILEKYTTKNGTTVEVKKTSDSFVVHINGLEVEYFKTKAAADEAAKEAIEAMESDE